MTKFTIFTPSHNPKYLDECYRSIAAQTVTDWEWIVVLNGGVQWAPPELGVPVMVMNVPRSLGVGEAKNNACDWAHGEILVELDHDDLLAPDALEKIGAAFDANPGASLVYSHWGQILEDGSPDRSEFSAEAGWTYRVGAFDGRPTKHAVAMAPTPHNVSYIWFAPNHVRAFRASAYTAAGGYDPALDILDDQDLMARLYLEGDFVLVDECLYLQRMHENNTHRDGELNARIQRETVALYDKYFEGAALAWAKRQGLSAWEARRSGEAAPGYRTLFNASDPRYSVWDLSDIPDDSVGVIRAYETLPLAEDPVGLMDEIFRVLAPGGVVLTTTPSTEGRGAYQDPFARSVWNENSFWYFTEDAYRERVPGLRARFQVSRSVTVFPSEWHEVRGMSYAFVNLIAIKEGVARNGGKLLTEIPAAG